MPSTSTMIPHINETSFQAEVGQLVKDIVGAIRSRNPLNTLIDSWHDPIYIKSADGQMLVANKAYEHTFAGDVSSVGRFSSDYLNETIKPVSASSDALIMQGCTSVDFEHLGRDQHGRMLLLRTIKRSLLGSGHTRAAILGVTRIVEVQTENPGALRLLDLARVWEQFVRLDDREKKVAVLVAKGESVKDMAKILDVSDKTIENRRNSGMRKLGVENQAGLIRLMVRFQDNGFHDFGL
ncbi:helix-turn-helix transcriptional regulator [Novipirellula rosea]|uniref:HTH luxR-type domain-containing protein n=1 Tax=Novipirellula rosea TaxID=1031540 RepID=A0ABP8MSM8_9BACT|tara:strand:- start:4760 stop:5473 length:714 start_codon:yes stop_codon:yes gene_type:complete